MVADGRFVVVVCALVFALPALGTPFVDVHDACPVPTPYPPAGAGAGIVHNQSMEEGFTGGVANGWVSWKEEMVSGQVFFDGSDYHTDGGHSQKLVLPQPPYGYGEREAAIYQQIYVVPGEMYTASVRIRLHFPPQDYNGEDLIAWLGLDPFGQPSGSGSGTEWDTYASSQDQWITKQITVRAVLPVMTIALKGTRKYAQHGGGAEVWFDQVSFSGLIPTDPPPGPEPDPIDPETLIPETDGANIVANPGFEAAFSNGVSAGWNKWWTLGAGTWKRSSLIGPVGGGNYAWCGVPGDIEDMRAMRSKTYLVQDRKSYAQVLGNDPNLDNTVIVGRIYIDPEIETYLSDPEHYGRVHADNCRQEQMDNPRIDCWQGFNEPATHTEMWPAVIAFEKAFAERCHEQGMKACVLNLSTGSPGNIWRMLDARELLEVGDYLGHHTYGGPADELMVAAQNIDDPCAFSLRPRRFEDMYARRNWRFPPVISTESTTYGGWHGRFTPQEITDDLILYGQYLKADPWFIGTTIFTVGGCRTWAEWDITGLGIAGPVGDWNATHPTDATEGLYAQMFGAGKTHPMTLSEMLDHGGQFNGGVNQQVTGLIPGREYLLICWMKYEFRGAQPDQLKFYLGVDQTGQTTNGNATTLDWGNDQIADKAPVHEIFTHVWRTFIANDSTVSIWLRANHPTQDPAVMVYADHVELLPLVLPPGPTIQLSTGEINAISSFGQDPAPTSFTIHNSGTGTINYTITSDTDWVAVTPTTGSSTGESDTIAVVFDVAGVVGQHHTATLTVNAIDALNSPQTITVHLIRETVAPDFDVDGDVDQADFGHFQSCLSGPGVARTDPSCLNARLDGDEDVDQDDFGIFQNCTTGPDKPVTPGCDNY